MNERLLVAYGSKRGSTAEIAEMIGTTLREEGFDVDVLPAAVVDDVSSYRAVVIGGALYGTRWHHDARMFGRHHAAALAERPVWLFSSGPLDSSELVSDMPPVRSVARVRDRVHARDHVTFGGRLDRTARGLVAWWILHTGKGGDYRDADRITRWSRSIAEQLHASVLGWSEADLGDDRRIRERTKRRSRLAEEEGEGVAPTTPDRGHPEEDVPPL